MVGRQVVVPIPDGQGGWIDQITGLPIDPATGQIYGAAEGVPADFAKGFLTNPKTGHSSTVNFDLGELAKMLDEGYGAKGGGGGGGDGGGAVTGGSGGAPIDPVTGEAYGGPQRGYGGAQRPRGGWSAPAFQRAGFSPTGNLPRGPAFGQPDREGVTSWSLSGGSRPEGGGAENPIEGILGLIMGLLSGLLGIDIGGDGGGGWGGGRRSGNAGSSFMQGVSGGGGGTPTTSDGGGSCAGGVCR